MKNLKELMFKLKRAVVVSVVSLSVLSCGGETAIISAGISGTGIVFGAITGFGSVFVNGVKYEVDNASFDVDGNLSGGQDDLKIGMVVRMETTAFDDGTFEANSIVYDDSIEGPITTVITDVSASVKEFTVMGVEVRVDDSNTTFHNSSSTASFNFDNIAQNDVIEVSGFLDANGKVLATLVEKKGELTAGGTAFVEMHGIVTTLVPDVSFVLNGVLVNYGPATEVDDDLPSGVQDGIAVEVKGLYDGSSIQASEIESEDDDGIGSSDPNTSVSVQGAIANFTSVDSQFSVSGVQVLVNTSVVPQSILDQLVEGLNVEVEGTFDSSGVLQADQVEIRESQAEYMAIVRSIDLGAESLNIGYPQVTGELVMQFDATSTILDEDDNPISLINILVGDDVKINARIVDNEHRVVRLKRERGTDKDYEITGEVEASVPNASGYSSFTIEGLVFPMADPSQVTYDLSFGIPPDVDVPTGTVIDLEDDNRDGFFDDVGVPD